MLRSLQPPWEDGTGTRLDRRGPCTVTIGWHRMTAYSAELSVRGQPTGIVMSTNARLCGVPHRENGAHALQTRGGVRVPVTDVLSAWQSDSNSQGARMRIGASRGGDGWEFSNVAEIPLNRQESTRIAGLCQNEDCAFVKRRHTEKEGNARKQR